MNEVRPNVSLMCPRNRDIYIRKAAAYIRREIDYVYEPGLYKTRSTRINGSRLIRSQCLAFMLIFIAIAELRGLSR